MNTRKNQLPEHDESLNGAVYDADSITVLPGLEAVRKNPSMYIGSTDIEGLHRLVYEVVDNSIDESLDGHCADIQVILGKDGSCSIEDDGRGIPVSEHPEEGVPACEVVLTRLHAGGKFRLGSYYRTAGIHGVGLSCVNALAEWLELDIWRDSVHHRQRYSRGTAEGPLERMGKTGKRGTRIRFKPDPKIFETDSSFSYRVLSRRLEELAFLHPGILIRIEDRRTGDGREYRFSSGIVGFVKHLNESRSALHDEPVRITYSGRDIEFDAAMQWTTGYGEDIHSYVNSINTIYGGTHVSGLKTALTKSINAYARDAKLFGVENSERITTFDILEGLTCVLSVKMTSPRFEGQTKTRLTSREVKTRVSKTVAKEFRKILDSNSRLALQVVSRALDATRARLAARRASDSARFQSVDTRVSEKVYQKQFGIRAKNWHDSAVWLTDAELIEHHVSHMEAGPEARILDVCCGSGVVGEAFKGRAGIVEGLDLTPEMIELAKERLDIVHKGTVYDLPFEENEFDLVVTREVLHLLPNPEKPVSEIFRVLKPGGQFIVGQILPYGSEDGAWMYRIFKKKQPLIFNMFQEEDFVRLLLGAGFTNLEMTEYTLWESIDVWIDTHETTNLHRHEIRDLFYNAPQEAKNVHPFEITPSGGIRDLWRWCIFSVKKPDQQ